MFPAIVALLGQIRGPIVDQSCSRQVVIDALRVAKGASKTVLAFQSVVSAAICGARERLPVPMMRLRLL